MRGTLSETGAVANVIEPVELTAAEGALLLRPPRRAEAAEAMAMLRDAEVAQWNPAPAVVDLPSARAWCDRGADWAAGGHATFSIVVASTGAYAGNISLFEVDFEHAVGSVGYRIAAQHRRRGVATAALAAVRDWAFRDVRLERVQLFHAVPNHGSCVVAERCGFLLEGVLRSGSVFGDGERYDEHLHARLATDGAAAAEVS
jgi:RimJ/RimL family protein N-acetyltransferase